MTDENDTNIILNTEYRCHKHSFAACVWSLYRIVAARWSDFCDMKNKRLFERESHNPLIITA